MAPTQSGSYRVLLYELFRKRVWLLYLSRMICCMGIFIIAPFLHTEVTHYFTGRHTDEDVDCTKRHNEDGAGDQQPPACVAAHNDVLLWTTAQTLVHAFTFSLFMNPSVGTWSDMYGRKPFLVIATLLHTIMFLVVVLYKKMGLPLYWYYISRVLAQPFNPQAVCLAYLADTINEGNLILAFALLTLTFTIGMIGGSLLTMSGLVNSLETAAYMGLTMVLIATFIVLVLLPESLATDQQLKTRAIVAERRLNAKAMTSRSCTWTPFVEAIKILWRTQMFRKLTIIMFIVGILAEECMDFKAQYLQEVIGFGTAQQKTMFLVMGVSGFFMMTVGTWLVRPVFKLSDKHILVIGLALMTAGAVTLAGVQTTWMAYLSSALMSAWSLNSMAVSALKARNVDPEEQGAVQGALSAVATMGFGLGPLVFFGIYYAFRSGNFYFPNAPFCVAALAIFGALCIAFTIDVPKSREFQLSTEDNDCEELKEPIIPQSTTRA